MPWNTSVPFKKNENDLTKTKPAKSKQAQKFTAHRAKNACPAAATSKNRTTEPRNLSTHDTWFFIQMAVEFMLHFNDRVWDKSRTFFI